MKSRRMLGVLFVIAAAIGIVFCLYGIFQTWRVRPGFTKTAGDNLALLGDTIETTRDGLEVVEQVLQTTAEDLSLVQTSIQTLTLAIRDTNQILDSLAGLTGEDLPATIGAAQTSLESAQSSALLIDNVLFTLTSFPFLGMDAYRPEVPLNVALGEISTSLDPLLPSLADVSDGLDGAATNLGDLEVQLRTIAETSEKIDTALIDAQRIIGDYQLILVTLSAQVEAAQQALPGWIGTTAWVVTILLGVVLSAQIGLLDRGLEMMRVQEMTFVPKDFNVPAMLETKYFRLRMLSVGDVEKDYEAVMETQAHFHSMGLSWPREGFTIEENRADLERHQHEFFNREAFAYTVVSHDESRVLGCVYINPAKGDDFDANIEFWVRKSEIEKGLGPILFNALQEWMDSDWPFASVDYPMRYMRI